MRIGILGGSFDPIHQGHLHMAKEAHDQFSLDEVWLIPNGHAPHKEEDKMTSSKHRLKMCQIAAKTYPFLKVNDIEIKSEDSSYTYLTMEKLCQNYPHNDFFFIMGADSLDYFDKWKKPERICQLCQLLIVNRNDFTQEELNKKKESILKLFPANIDFIHCKKINVSSTEIRKGKKQEYLLDEVQDYIQNNHLYE